MVRDQRPGQEMIFNEARAIDKQQQCTGNTNSRQIPLLQLHEVEGKL